MHLPAAANLFLKLALAAVALSGSVLSAQIYITLSPVAGDDTLYRIDVSGTGDTVAFDSTTGGLSLDGYAFTYSSPPASGLTFGGVAATAEGSVTYYSYSFSVATALSSGSAYSFVTGSATASTAPGHSYGGTFSPGVYTITAGSGFFGSHPGGTFTILSTPIPEPATAAALASLAALGVACWHRRRPSAVA